MTSKIRRRTNLNAGLTLQIMTCRYLASDYVDVSVCSAPYDPLYVQRVLNLPLMLAPGRKFAQTEMICFVASLLRDWRIEPLYGPQQGETKEAWDANVINQAHLAGTAFSLKKVPLKFVRRDANGA